LEAWFHAKETFALGEQMVPIVVHGVTMAELASHCGELVGKYSALASELGITLIVGPERAVIRLPEAHS
jgi:hypothetical protein